MLSKDREAHADSLGRIYKKVLSIQEDLPGKEIKTLAKKIVEDEITRATSPE